MSLQTALLRISYRKFRIWRKGHGRFLLPVIIIFDIRASALLIRPQNQAYIFRHGNSQLLYSPHGIESCHSRSLVVSCSPPIKPSILNNRLKGLRHRPSLSCWNYIQMSQNIQLTLLIIQICRSHIVIIINSGKAVPFRHSQGRLKGVKGSCSKGFTFYIRHFFTVNSAKPTDILNHFVPMSIHIAFNLILVHHFVSFYLHA